MKVSKEQIGAFLTAVKAQKLDDELSTAARHHSAVNVTEADNILKSTVIKPRDDAQKED